MQNLYKILNPVHSKALVLCFFLLMLGWSNNAFAQFAIMEDFRGNGNPDIIIGGPGGAGGTAYLTSGIDDPVNQGWLRLTSSNGNQRGYAYINNSFPSTSGVLIDFEYKIWRDVDDDYDGADGLGVFLFDATSTFSMGGYGGSLGYAPNGGSGLAGGYVGVGFDEYGNYSNPTEGRVGGPGEVPNAVVLRGPTTNNGATTNPYLAGAALGDRTGGNGAIRGRNEIDYNTQTSTRPTDAQFYRRVQIEILPLDEAGVYYQIIVRWKKSTAANFTELISYTTTTPPPPLLKLGFAASTGGGVNYHEIRNLLVTTPGNLRVDKRADKDILRTVSGDNNANQITYTIEVTNDTDIDALNVDFNDRITDANGNLIAEGNPGFNITSIIHEGFSSITLPTPESLTTNEINGTFSLAANSVGKIYVIGVLSTVPEGSSVINTASADLSLDEDTSNNTKTISIPVYAEGIDIVVSKTVDNSCLDTVNGNTFTLQVANIGQNAANYSYSSNWWSYTGRRIRVTEVVPSGYTLTQTLAQYNGWDRYVINDTPSAGDTTYVYSIGDNGESQGTLDPGEVYNYPITFTITGSTGYTNQASVVYERRYASWVENETITPIETPANQTNNTDSVTIMAMPPAPTVTTPVRYCQGETAVPLTATKTDSSYDLKWYTVPGGFASDTPFTPNTTIAGTYTYYVSQVNGECEGPTASIQVVAYGTPTAGAIGSNQTICNGATPAQLTSTTAGTAPSGGTISYRWESSANGTSGWTTIAGETSSTYQPPALTATRHYRRITVVTNGGKLCESASTSNVVITVMAVINPGSIGSNQTICNGATPANLTSSAPGTGTGTISYRWERSSNGTSGWTSISGTNNLTYQPPALTATRYYRRVTVATSGSASCEAATTAVQITVNATVTAGSIGANQTICYGTAPSLLTSTANGTGTGTISYRWESSSNGSTGWTIISGATSETYQPGALTANTYFRRTTVATSGVACTSSPTSSVLITVNNAVNAGSIGSNQTICYNTVPAVLTSGSSGSGTGAITYRWESSPNGSSWTAISGTNSTTYQPPALTVTTHYRRVTIATSGVACEAITSAVVITVNAVVTAGSIGSNHTICYNTTPALLTSGSAGTGTGTITYRWESSSNGSTGWATISGATGATYQPGALTATRYYRRITIATSGTMCESSPTSSVQITVNNAVTSGSIGSNQTICYNTVPSLLTSGSVGTGTGTITYRWESSPNGSTGWTTISGATGVTYQPGALTANTYFRRITIATSGATCTSSPTSSVLITVNNAVTAGSIGSAQTICVDTTPALLTSVSDGTGTGSITYRWESSANGTSGWAAITGATESAYQPGILTATTYYRRITVAASGAVCESSPTAIIAITTKKCKLITNPMIYQRVKN